MRKKVENEIERLEKDGIIQRKLLSVLATLLIPVLKREGSVRIRIIR